MITETREIYKCEYCNKKMFGKGAMSLHERQCCKNPKNRHKCFQYCKWLNKDTCDSTGFKFFTCGNDKCNLCGSDLHSYKLERNYEGQQRIKDEELIRMPLVCPFYEIESGHDEDYINSLK